MTFARNLSNSRIVPMAGFLALTAVSAALAQTIDGIDELKKQGFDVHKSQVRLPNGPIKTVGDTTVAVSLHTDVDAEITVSVYGESA